MITNQRMRDIAVSLFKQESDRDKQKKIGASDFSDPCAYHLAKKLLGEPEDPMKYWLGGKIGTAVHSFLEDAMTKADLELLPELKSAVVEEKIYLGELEGYGTINSKPDLVLVEDGHLVDWKTSSRDKTRKMQKVLFGESSDASVTYSLKKYYTQAQIYAWGLNKAGTKIDACSLVFINRDGTTENDIWAHTFEYDESHAEAAWLRLEGIWAALQVSRDPEQFEKDADCFKCRIAEPA
jgi:hypothetical protein